MPRQMARNGISVTLAFAGLKESIQGSFKHRARILGSIGRCVKQIGNELGVSLGIKTSPEALELAGCEVLCQAADIDESPLDGENPKQRASRLAMSKALKVRETYTDRLIIGSDQVAHLNNQLLRKPGNHQGALNQLCRSAGQSVFFETALAVVFGPHQLTELITTEIEFWPFDRTQADRYLSLSNPMMPRAAFTAKR